MRKFLIFLLSVGITSSVFAFSSNSVSAHHQEVLGVATAQTLSIPPTTEGPGFILPDSPLFFLDQLKQKFRLFLAFSPEQKAKIYNAVAGERLAELRIMLSKNNVSGVRIALAGVSDNLKNAAGDITHAKLTGRNISLLAKEINDSIKEKKEKLSFLEDQARGELKAQVKAAKEALKVAKVEVEDSLPEDLLLNEIEDDLDEEIEENVQEASSSAKGLAHAIDVLTRLASQAAEKEQTRRQEALMHAIEVKSDALLKQQEKFADLEERKLQVLLEARKGANKVGEGASEVQEAQRRILNIKNQSEITPIPTPAPTKTTN